MFRADGSYYYLDFFKIRYYINVGHYTPHFCNNSLDSCLIVFFHTKYIKICICRILFLQNEGYYERYRGQLWKLRLPPSLNFKYLNFSLSFKTIWSHVPILLSAFVIKWLIVKLTHIIILLITNCTWLFQRGIIQENYVRSHNHYTDVYFVYLLYKEEQNLILRETNTN